MILWPPFTVQTVSISAWTKQNLEVTTQKLIFFLSTGKFMQQIIWIRYQNEWNQLGIHESHSQLIKGSEARLPNLAVRRTWFQGVQYQLGLSVIGIHGRKPSLLHAKSSKIPFVFDMWLTRTMYARLHGTFNFVERHKFFLSVSLFSFRA